MSDQDKTVGDETDLGEADYVERQITAGTNLVLRGKQESLAGPLFAINWFDTKPAWVYHFYNFLAGSRLTKAGGRALFKARVVKSLSGDEALARQFLLIVNYPAAENFLNLASDRFFLLISVLRMISVRRFSFVMHQRLDDQANTKGLKSYAVVHFSASEPSASVNALRDSTSAHIVQIGFTGQRAVTAATQGKDGETAMPYVTDNTVLLMAESDTQLQEYFSGPDFQRFVSSADNHYAGLLRLLLRAENE